MNDIEGLLRRYRAADPPERLRARVVDRAEGAVRLWPWAAAAAALLACLTGFHAGSTSLRANVSTAFPVAWIDDERERLVEALGGGAAARARAEYLIATQAVTRRALDESAPSPMEQPR
jgi:hypothetical protein